MSDNKYEKTDQDPGETHQQQTTAASSKPTIADARGLTYWQNTGLTANLHWRRKSQALQIKTLKKQGSNYQEKLSITVLIVDARMKKVLIAINTPIMTVGFTSLTSSFSNA